MKLSASREQVYRITQGARLDEMPALGRGIYLGGSVADGNAWTTSDQISLGRLKYGMSLFVAADSTLAPLYVALGCGPLYFALGRGAGGAHAIYLFRGRP